MQGLEKWHVAVKNRDLNVLDEILAEDVVFYSPVVWKAQHGKDITKLYLSAAMFVLANEDFKYEREIVSGNRACLEFSTKVEETIINGVDIITFNDEGKIIEFKVMVRPLRAMMTLKEKMLELMQKMSG